MVKDNLAGIKARIKGACERSKRSPDAVTMLAVCKNRTVDQIAEVIRAGIFDVGENKVQEALSKYEHLRAPSTQLQAIKWHMVGHLQTNKVKDAVKIFNLIHSVDSLHLAQEINKQALNIGKIQDILIEIKTSPEATKFGLKPEEAVGVIQEIARLKNIKVKGLMTIAPLVDDPENARPYFRQLRELRNSISSELRASSSELMLSMGMTDDFEVAIEEGADIIRLGRAIFD